MNLSEKLIRLCRLVEDSSLSIKYNIEYKELSDGEQRFEIDLSKVVTDRLTIAQNTIQSSVDDGVWKKTSEEQDSANNIVEYTTPRGDLTVYYNLNSVFPVDLLFSSKEDSKEFFDKISADEEEVATNSIEKTGDNPMTPDQFAKSAPADQSDVSVAPQTSSVGDDAGSVNFS